MKKRVTPRRSFPEEARAETSDEKNLTERACRAEMEGRRWAALKLDVAGRFLRRAARECKSKMCEFEKKADSSRLGLGRSTQTKRSLS